MQSVRQLTWSKRNEVLSRNILNYSFVKATELFKIHFASSIALEQSMKHPLDPLGLYLMRPNMNKVSPKQRNGYVFLRPRHQSKQHTLTFSVTKLRSSEHWVSGGGILQAEWERIDGKSTWSKLAAHEVQVQNRSECELKYFPCWRFSLVGKWRRL